MGSQSFVLPWPISTNAIWRSYNGRNVLSKRARAWTEAAGKELVAQNPTPVIGPVALGIALSPPTKRAYDIDNRVKGLIDLLVKHQVIEADDSRILKTLYITASDGIPGAFVIVQPI